MLTTWLRQYVDRHTNLYRDVDDHENGRGKCEYDLVCERTYCPVHGMSFDILMHTLYKLVCTVSYILYACMNSDTLFHTWSYISTTSTDLVRDGICRYDKAHV